MSTFCVLSGNVVEDSRNFNWTSLTDIFTGRRSVGLGNGKQGIRFSYAHQGWNGIEEHLVHTLTSHCWSDWTGLDWTAFLIGNDGIYSGDDPVARPSLYLLGWSNYLFSLPKTVSGLYPYRCPCFSERDQIRE